MSGKVHSELSGQAEAAGTYGWGQDQKESCWEKVPRGQALGLPLVLLEPIEIWTHVGQSQNRVGPIQRLTDRQPKAN